MKKLSLAPLPPLISPTHIAGADLGQTGRIQSMFDITSDSAGRRHETGAASTS